MPSRPAWQGKLGHIYEHGDGLLGVLFQPHRPRKWANARRKLEAAGLTIWQDGDDEGSALFDSKNATQVRLALKIIRARPKRVLTPQQREARMAALEKARERLANRSQLARLSV